MPSTNSHDREVYDEELATIVAGCRPDLVVLAGWAHVPTASFLDVFPGKVIRLRPALPGTFPGMNGIRQAYEAHKTDPTASAGVMTHFVTPGEDDGRCIQALRVPIRDGESYEDLERRVRERERDALVLSLRTLVGHGAQGAPGRVGFFAGNSMTPAKIYGAIMSLFALGGGSSLPCRSQTNGRSSSL